MKKNMLIRTLSLICVLACLFAFASCHDDLATKEEVKTDLEGVKTELNEAIAAVRKTADAAAVKTDLNAALARLDAVEGTANAAATLEALNAVKADLASVKLIAEAAAVKAEVDAAIAAINEAIEAVATKAELAAVKAELEAAITGNTADVEAIEAVIETLATKAEVADVKAALEAAIAGNTADIEAIETTIATLATKTEVADAVAAAKTELNGVISGLETKLQDQITANKNKIDAIEKLLGDADVEELVEKIALLEEMLEGIDIYGEFEKNYGPLTEKLLNPEYEYAYSKFVEIVLDIDDGPYDPDEAKAVRLQAENILFEVTRATSEDGLKALYDELVSIKTNLKTLEESLTEKVNAITYINTSAECIELVKAADKLYEKMIELEIEFENPDLKAKYERIWNAYIELNGGLTKDETVNHVGLKNDAANDIDKAFAAILNRDVKLGSTDAETIANYQAAIVALKEAIDNSAYRDLYEAGLAEGVIEAVTAEVIAEKTAAKVAELNSTKRDEYKGVYEAAFIVTFIGYTEAEGVKTPVADGLWETEIIKSIAKDLMAADAELAEADALTQAAEAYAADASKYTANVDAAYLEAQALATVEVAKAEVKANLYAQADAQIAEEAAAYANEYAASNEGDQAIYVRAMAESLYNEDAAEAIAERYENMLNAANDAIALVGEVKTIINNWDTTGLLWNDVTASTAQAAISEWVKNVAYKSANEAYIAAYKYAADDITEFNRDYVFGTYTGTITNYAQLSYVSGYVAALKGVYDNYNFVARDGDTEIYNVSGVAALIGEIKKAVNGVGEAGALVLDVDNIAVDLVKASINELNGKINEAANKNSIATDLNFKAMIPAIVLERIAVIEDAEGKLAAIVNELKAKYYDTEKNEWNVNEINAAEVIEAFETRIAEQYANVQKHSFDPDYVIYNVTSSLTEAAVDGAYASFEKFTEFAGQKYKEAKALIEKLEALGAVKLNHGKDIYDVTQGLKALSVVIPGLTYETRFPVKNDETGEYEMVDFYILQDKINNKYVPEYAALAKEAEAKAAELKTAIDELVAKVGNNANKLDNFNDIVNMMTRVKVEWLDAFYSDDMLAEAGEDKYATANNAMAAIKAAVAATTDTKIIGKVGATYAFLTNETYASLETITKTAISTYAAVETKAEKWIEDAEAIVNGGNYTFHDWDKAGNNFKNIEERYQNIVKDYYIITALTTDTDPDFGLFEAHEAFVVEYDKCKAAYEDADDEIKAIEDAINALGAYTTITLDNTAETRAAVKAIYDAIANFEANFCSEAQTDGDIDADLLFYLAKYNGLVEIAEYWVSKKVEWPETWNALESFNIAIETIDSSMDTAVEFGRDKYEALADFINVEKSTVDKEIENAANA